MEQTENNWCFACGSQNPIGLKMVFDEREDGYYSEFVVNKNYQGYDGIVHGGILSTMLDEVMARYIYSKGKHAVTAELNVRFLKPVYVNERILIKGKIQKETKKIFEMSGEIVNQENVVCVTAFAKIVVLK